MIGFHRFKTSGYTLIEIVMTIAILSIVTVVSIQLVGDTLSEGNFELTRQEMIEIRNGLVGNPEIKNGNTRTQFGFLGDIGALPTVDQGIRALIRNPGLPDYAVDDASRFGAGWNGPYLKADDSGKDFETDAWGTRYIFDPDANPPTLTSYGADRQAGGTGLDQDITLQIPDNHYQANVYGVILSNGSAWSGKAEIEINYPDGAGAITQRTTMVDLADNGAFQFDKISLGVRSLSIYIPTKAAATSTYGPLLFNVDQNHYQISTRYTDIGGTSVLAPVLNIPMGYIFHLTQIDPGTQITLDWNNTNTGDDTDMTYACTFDRDVTGGNSAGTDCTSLYGTSSFDTANGKLVWKPTSFAWGPYEICVTGTNSAGSNTSCTIVNVKLGYQTTNLLAYFDSAFSALNGGQGSNGTAWYAKELKGGGSFTLNNFAKTTSSGFAGLLPNLNVGEKLNPYRLVFDGTNDSMMGNTTHNSQTGFVFDSWINPSSVTSTNTVIVSNGVAAGTGFTLSQSRYSRRLQLTLGYRSYVDEVMSDSPIGFYRLNESAGTTMANFANSALNGTSGGTVTYGNTSVGVSDNLARSISINAGRVNLGQGAIKTTFDSTSSFSVEMWVNPTSHPTGANFRWLLCKANTTDTGAIKYQFDIRQVASGGLQVTLWRSNNNMVYLQYASNAATNPIVTGAWNHIVTTYNLTSQTLSLYLNGTLLGTATGGSGQYTGNYATDTVIGENRNVPGTSSFIGGVSDVSIYNTVLTLARVQAHYSSALRPTCYSTSSLSNSTWYHIGGLFLSGTSMRLYVNGSGECSLTKAATYSGSTANLTFGTDPSATRAWSGALGEFRLYSSSATVTDITSNRTATSTKYP